MSDQSVEKVIKELGLDPLDFLNESNTWFLLEDKMLSPGMYRVQGAKMLNSTFEEMVKPKDQVRVLEDCYPVGDVLGIDIYEAIHVNTNQKVYISSMELIR